MHPALHLSQNQRVSVSASPSQSPSQSPPPLRQRRNPPVERVARLVVAVPPRVLVQPRRPLKSWILRWPITSVVRLPLLPMLLLSHPMVLLQLPVVMSVWMMRLWYVYTFMQRNWPTLTSPSKHGHLHSFWKTFFRHEWI